MRLRRRDRPGGVVAAPRLSRRRALAGLAAALAACCPPSLSGCAVYRFGAQSLYPPDIQTIYVPVFESDSFRRYLAEWLTEALVKEIHDKTPYKVVGTAQADSVLSGKITSDTKRVIIEDAYDYPRETQVNLAIEVRWVNRRGQLVTEPIAVNVPENLAVINGDGAVVPEFGQSVATAQLQAIQSLATQIVSLMESPW